MAAPFFESQRSLSIVAEEDHNPPEHENLLRGGTRCITKAVQSAENIDFVVWTTFDLYQVVLTKLI